MFYVYKTTITTSYIADTPLETTLDLISGVIHQVDVLFEDGCDYEANVQILHGTTQIWPSNPGEAITGNAIAVSFREFYELPPGATDLTLRIWGDGTIDDVQVVVQIGLLPKRILQPLSFDELLAAAMGM